MILKLKSAFPSLDKVKFSRTIGVSGVLTFLHLIELCIGARTVYQTFYLWNNPTYTLNESSTVSWTLCLACLLSAVVSTFVVNLISAVWEQRQIKEAGGEKSVLRFAGHLVAGGMVWRYIMLWFCDGKDEQKKQTLLLTMTKFFHTQFFTIPLVIVHTSLLENLEEIIFDVFSIVCISLNLILTCIVFSWCKSVVGDLKKWNYETVDLVPLIFSQSNLEEESSAKDNDSNSINSENKNVERKSEVLNENIERIILRSAVFFQTFCFSLGRLLALGILLKMAGIYAVSIMFLQLLISVIYLKFQVPILISDTLPKWRQLTRLAFMSYILIFEWHLNRDTRTGYDFNSNIKHSILYYSIATLESIFYLVTWAITTNFVSNDIFDSLNKDRIIFVRDIIIIGISVLLISLMIHISILLWQSRRISTFMHCVRRRYASSKLKMSLKRYKCANSKLDDTQAKRIEISNSIPIDDSIVKCCDVRDSRLEKHNSYKDLREPIDEEIEIYSRKKAITNKTVSIEKCVEYPAEVNNKSEVCRADVDKSPNIIKEQLVKSARFKRNDCKKENLKTTTEKSSNYVNKIVSNFNIDSDDNTGSYENKTSKSVAKPVSVKGTVQDDDSEKVADNDISSEKSKIAIFSETFNNQWSKISSVPQKFMGSMREEIKKRKEQLQLFRVGMNKKENDVGKTENYKGEDNCTVENDPPKQFSGEVYYSEGYFVGDERCYDENYNNEPEHTQSDLKTEEEKNNAVVGNSCSFEIDQTGVTDEECSETTSGDNEVLNSVHCDENKNDLELGYNDEIEDDLESGLCDGSEESWKSADSDGDKEVLESVDINGTEDDSEPAHCDGVEPCPCYVCRAGSGRLHRRRSSSVPPDVRSHFSRVNELTGEDTLARYPSSPDIVSVDLNQNYVDTEKDSRVSSPSIYPKKFEKKLSLMSPVSRMEHFV